MLYRRSLFFGLLLLTLGVARVWSAPAQQGSLGALTAFFPQDAYFYAAIRADQPHIDTIDRLVEYASANLPRQFDLDVPPSLTAAVDQVLRPVIGGSFQSSVRPWLGDTLAAGAYQYHDQIQLTVVVRITDMIRAVATLERGLDDWSRQDQSGVTVYTSPDQIDSTTVVVYPDTLLITTEGFNSLPAGGRFNVNLSANPLYQSSLSMLPFSNYNLIGFVDTPMLLAASSGSQLSSTEEKLLLSALFRVIGPTAFGGTILNSRTLTLDIAQSIGNKTGLEALGIDIPGEGAVLEPEFMENVPTDSILVMQGVDPDANLNFLRTSAGNFTEAVGPAFNTVLFGLAYNAFSLSQVGLFTTLVNNQLPEVIFANLTGFDYEQDISSWLKGNHAAFIGLNPAYDPNSLGMTREPLDGGIIFQIEDPESVGNFLSKLVREIPLIARSLGDAGRVRVTEVPVAGGAEAVVITIVDYRGEREILLDEFLVASDGNLLVFGTRRAVNQVFGRDEIGFSVGQEYLLPDAGFALHVNSPPARSAPWTDFLSADPGVTLLQLMPFLTDDLSASAAGTSNGDLLLRLALTVRDDAEG